jgi:hypothetical protein
LSYSYGDQLAIVSKVRLADGETHRGNCPFCGGRNTFTLTRSGEQLKWNCYRASCDAGGYREGEDSLLGVRRRLDSLDLGASGGTLHPIPSPLTPIDSQPQILRWLDKVGSLEAYSEGLIPIRYSPTEDRIMFPVQDGLGYIGRGRADVRPKWRKYGDTSHLLTVGHGPTAVLVEDAPSACAVGVLPEYTGCALLGTRLDRQHILELRRFERVVVCLDPDAQSKSMAMVSTIGSTIPATMRLISDDLKNLPKHKIQEELNGICE